MDVHSVRYIYELMIEACKFLLNMLFTCDDSCRLACRVIVAHLLFI
jgi:hypothetical protein